MDDVKNIPLVNSKNILKFIISSLIGIVLFFVPVVNSEVPVVAIVEMLENLLDPVLIYLVLIICLMLLITYIMAKFMGVERFKKRHEKDGPVTGILYLISVIVTIMMITGKGPWFIVNEDVGGLATSLGCSVMLTVTVAGWLVVFIIKSGIVEFVGTLMEPIMRPLYKIPGQAAVNAVSSFVSAPAVGVYITNTLYHRGVYTQREASAIMTNFSICSLGFFAVILSILNHMELYPQTVLTSSVVTFILAAIMIRVPPLSMKPNVYVDGREQTKEDLIPKKGALIPRAINAGLVSSSNFTLKAVMESLFEALNFMQKIVTYVVSIAVISLALAEYTPLFDWLGTPMIPLLKLCGLPNAAEIAPSTLIGITEIAMPALLIAGKDIALKSIFFIAVLSTVQIIFFTECANAILETDVPLSAVDLISIFLIRTIIATPLVAIAAHLLF